MNGYLAAPMIAPIAMRELLVASRQPLSWRIRLVTTLCGVLIALFVLTNASSLRSAGSGMFQVLSILVFVYATGAGLVLTADCISEERREGTFGLLYLTPLSSWDVILGKLAVSSLQGVFGLVAIVPMLFLSVSAGGVTGEEVVRAVLMLAATLFLSLSAGIFASASARSRRGALGLTGVLIAGPLIFGWIGALITSAIGSLAEDEKKRRANVLWWAGFGALCVFLMWMVALSGDGLFGSPLQMFLGTSRQRFNFDFLASLVAIVAIGSFYLFSATLCTEWYRAASKVTTTKDENEHAVDDLLFPGLRPKKRVGIDPAGWLLTFVQPQPTLFYIALGVMVLVSLGHGIAPSGLGMSVGFLVFGMLPFIVFNFTLARFCAAPFHLLERSGFLEPLLTTPLGVPELASTQRGIYWAMLKLPMVFLVLASIPMALHYISDQQASGNFAMMYLVNWILSWLVFALHLETLAVLGMVEGMKGRKPFNAAMRTVGFVMIPELIMNVIVTLVGQNSFAPRGDGTGIFVAQIVSEVMLGAFFVLVLRSARPKVGWSGGSE